MERIWFSFLHIKFMLRWAVVEKGRKAYGSHPPHEIYVKIGCA
jgi:hypothetical protein